MDENAWSFVYRMDETRSKLSAYHGILVCLVKITRLCDRPIMGIPILLWRHIYIDTFPMNDCILLPFHTNIKFLNELKMSPSCPYCVCDIATWSYQTRGFHLLITSWYIFPVHHFTLAPLFAPSLICLLYTNKPFVMKMSYLLPRVKLLRVTFFMKWSYLFPRENSNCHISRTRQTRIPVLALNWDLVTSILYTKIARFHLRELCVFGPYLCRWSCRGRAGKKLTAVTFFRCPTVSLEAQKFHLDSIASNGGVTTCFSKSVFTGTLEVADIEMQLSQ